MHPIRPLLARTAAVLGLVTAALAAWLLVYEAFFFVLLVFAAVLLALFLTGLTGWLRDRVLPGAVGRKSALALVCLVLLGLAVLAGRILGAPVVDQFGQLLERIPGAVAEVQAWLGSTEWGQVLLRRVESEDAVGSRAGDILGRITGFFSTGLGIVANTFIVLVLGVYLAADWRSYGEGAVRLLPRAQRDRGREILTTLGQALRRWIGGRLASMLVVGILTGIGLAVLGVPLVLSLAAIAAAFSFVPFLGPLVSAVPAILVAWMERPELALWVAGLYGVVQWVESYLVTPLIQRRAVDMPPAILITGQILLGMVSGVLGILLATPLAVVVVVLVQTLYLQDALGEDVQVLGGS